MTIKNSQIGKRYYGRHFEPGVAQYVSPDENSGQPYNILLRKNAIDRMNPTFECCPVHVLHKDLKNPTEEKRIKVGTVVRSFFNEADAAYWAEFIVEEEIGHEKIAQGWTLSNAYRVTEDAPGGQWHAVPYVQEVMNGKFDHLAIVPNPRYENSVILTPEEFKAHNEKLKRERDLRTNSKEETMDLTKLKFWNRATANTDDVKKLLELSLQIGPKSREMTVAQIINDFTAHEEASHKAAEEEGKGNYPVANQFHMCEVEEGAEKKKMNVGDLVKAYNTMHKEYNAMKANQPGAGDAADEQKKKELEEKELADRQNALKAEEDKLAADKAALEAQKKEHDEKQAKFNERKNAIEKKQNETKDETAPKPVMMTMDERLALGKRLA